MKLYITSVSYFPNKFYINSGISTDGFHEQWIDLGIHTEACMTRPDTCGAAGGAVSLWLKENRCTDVSGMLTSKISTGTGFNIYCTNHAGTQ